MGIINAIRDLCFGPVQPHVTTLRHRAAQKHTAVSRRARRCQLEELEPRQLMAADLVPHVMLGSVYFEEATGDDSKPDIIQVSFVGGAAGTTMNKLTINGDKRQDGLTDGDIFFDTAAGGIGAFNYDGLKIVSANGFTVNSVTVVDGGTQIIFDLTGFDAGEKLVFSVDADEAQYVEGSKVDANSLVEGAEFQRSIMVGQFSAVGYVDLTLTGTYWDDFDPNFLQAHNETGLTLDLPNDTYAPDHDYTDRTAGAIVHAAQIPLASISGWVYHDHDDNGVFDHDGEQGIGGVTLELLDANGNPTGITTTTSTTPGKVGFYEFRNLTPGKYGVREVQPSGWLDGKDAAGDHGGAADPEVSGRVDRITGAILAYGDNGKEYNFGELLPGSISGRVHADEHEACDFDDPEILLEGVRIDLLDAQGNFIKSTLTNAKGEYRFDGLVPAVYQVREHNPAGYYDGGERVGSVGGVAADIGDTFSIFTGIALPSGVDAIKYDFCEKVGVTLSGNVYHDRDNDGNFDRPGEEGIGNVLLKLLDSAGKDTGLTATTDANGFYKFTNLKAGTYIVIEVQPAAWLDGKDTPGNLGGVADVAPLADKISQITIKWGEAGIEYNFGELLPGSIAGRVHADDGDDCDFDHPDVMLKDVQIDLLDSNGNVIATTYTNALGEYKFDNLAPNQTYTVREHNPAGYFDGGERVGTLGGAKSDLGAFSFLTGIVVGSDQHGVQYDFCEKTPGSISGRVHADEHEDCDFDDPEILLAGVQIDLLDGNGNFIRSTVTDVNGEYHFMGLAPGNYQVREHQPTAYYDGGERVGTAGGTSFDVLPQYSMFTGIKIVAGFDAVQYDFCEKVGVSLSGNVYHDRDNDGNFDRPGEEGIGGVLLKLLDANGNDTGLRATTDANGFYQFGNLKAGTYSVVEVQPPGWIDGKDTPGSVGGVADVSPPGDRISQIVLKWSHSGIEYNFGELLPGSIAGRVHADDGDDCDFDHPDVMLEGVQVDLLDSNGNVVATTYTNALGEYKFDNLAPGQTYSVREHNPTGYFDGGERVGTLGGQKSDAGNFSFISGINVGSDQHGVQYDFCEKLPGSIAGRVHADDGPDCDFDHPEHMLAGVQIDLLDGNGNFLRTTFTNAAGEYYFGDLAPGQYQVREHQPTQYYDGGERVGTAGGTSFDTLPQYSMFTGITIYAGLHAVKYDFCEKPGAEISGYVYIDGQPIVSEDPMTAEQIAAIRDGQHTSDDTPLAGVTLELRNGLTGAPILVSQALPGSYAGNPSDPIRVVTDANGYYHFGGLKAGTYVVVEVQPEGVIDNIDTPGTLGGIAINPLGSGVLYAIPPTQQELYNQLRDAHGYNVIIAIPLQYGQHAQENNFSEVTMVPPPPFVPPPPEEPPVKPPVFGLVGLPYRPPLIFLPYTPPIKPPGIFGGSSDVVGFSWHLSVVNAGWPRSITPDEVQFQLTSATMDAAAWKNMQMDQAEWTLAVLNGNQVEILREEAFGNAKSEPVTGDFNGDGISDIAVFVDGQWFVDLNGNGKWDEGDLWAKLGSQDDQPVTGDWDADGKTDIGIYGPAWARDPWAIEREPGLPDADNAPTKPTAMMKNMPPTPEDATSGARLLKRTARGKNRADVIDHVFHYGEPADVPVSGDWNGDGIRQIGVFRDGKWVLDTDGDGRFTEADAQVTFGQAGDKPVVGDFNGDGVEEIGVFRAGKWILDTNGNRHIDAQDKVFELGGAGDKPVVGDWNDDGTDDPGVFKTGKGVDRVSRRAG